MTIENEELMNKLVRTGMVMRHIDGAGPQCHKHGPHKHHHGPGHGPGEGPCHRQEPAVDDPAEQAEGAEKGCGCRHGHGFGHGPGHEHGHGPGHGPGHCHGHGHKPKGTCHRGQARVLTAVALKEGINQKELAFVLGIRPQTLGQMLQKLESHGMVNRAKSATDGRAIEVTLTERGRARATALAENRALIAADMFAALTDEEKEQLGAILDKLAAELEKHRPHRCCKKHEKGEEAEQG